MNSLIYTYMSFVWRIVGNLCQLFGLRLCHRISHGFFLEHYWHHLCWNIEHHFRKCLDSSSSASLLTPCLFPSCAHNLICCLIIFLYSSGYLFPSDMFFSPQLLQVISPFSMAFSEFLSTSTSTSMTLTLLFFPLSCPLILHSSLLLYSFPPLLPHPCLKVLELLFSLPVAGILDTRIICPFLCFLNMSYLEWIWWFPDLWHIFHSVQEPLDHLLDLSPHRKFPPYRGRK